jgi:hypothetical protein
MEARSGGGNTAPMTVQMLNFQTAQLEYNEINMYNTKNKTLECLPPLIF